MVQKLVGVRAAHAVQDLGFHALADLTDDEIFGAIVPTCIDMFSILTPLFVGVDPQSRDRRQTYLNLWYVV